MRAVKFSELGVKVPLGPLILAGTAAEIARDDSRSATARDTGALRVAGRLRHVPGRGHRGRRPAWPPGRDRGADRLRGGRRGDVVRRRAGRVGPAGRHRLAHRGGVLPAALRAAAADGTGGGPRGHRDRRERAGRRWSWPGVPLVLAATHAGKHGYVYGHASPPPCPGNPKRVQRGQTEPDAQLGGGDGEPGRRYGEPGRRDRRPPTRRGRGPRRRRAAAAHRGARGLAAAPEPGRRPAHLPRRGGHDHGPRRVLAGRARRRGRQPPAQLVLHRAAAHVHHRRAARTCWRCCFS